MPVASAYADDTTLVVSSVPAFLAVFDVYSLYERGSGAKLNYGKCEGFWLGCWNGRTDSPVNITWSSVFLGPGNLEEDNWRQRITAVQNALNLWRQRSLSYKGSTLVINALALSHVWYVASLIHVPRWVSVGLNTLLFKSFWSGKWDLVARCVVVQPSCLGGFSVVLFLLHLHGSLSWLFGFLPGLPLLRISFSLPPFYGSLLTAWQACKGSLTASSLGIGSGIDFCPVSAMSSKSAYLFLLSENAVSPHCEEKFFPLFGSLYWSCTWHQLSLFDLDRPVIDLCWKVSHGVLYTAERLAGFGYALSTACFCSARVESLQHLFFHCPLPVSVMSWLQSIMFWASPLCPSILVCHVLFGFSADELSVVPRVFVYMLNVCKFCIWGARNDFRFRVVRPSPVNVMEHVKSQVLSNRNTQF